MKSTWNITTMNSTNELMHYIRKEIKANIDNSGYWKQSIVCKIAHYGYHSMKAAWALFNMYFLETKDIDIEDFREIYNRTFKLNNYN